MLARRTRIKGIANIPQRKKPDVSTEKPKINTDDQTLSVEHSNQNTVEVKKEVVPVKTELDINEVTEVEPEIPIEVASPIEQVKERIPQPETPIERDVPKPPPVRRKFLKPGINLSSVKQRFNVPKGEGPEEGSQKIPSPSKIVLLSEVRIPKPDASTEQPQINTDIQTSIENGNQNTLVVKKEVASVKTEADTDEVSKVENESPAEDVPQTLDESEAPKPPPVRRKFLKPGINLNSVKQRFILPKVEAPQEIPHPTKIVLLSEVHIPSVCNVTKLISEPSNSDLFLNEEPLDVNPLISLALAPKIVTLENSISDSEYPAPPPSPSKINRARIKAIPKLGLRKASCSASESEDETRKYGRIRNNSICSVVSTISQEPPQTPRPQENLPMKEEGAPIQKKKHQSEQSRKLAEARREFYKKFGTTVPDKQKLRMIDLIFYNPSSSPLSKKEKQEPKEDDNETVVDDPAEQEAPEIVESNEPAEEENLPVPQIKIGPSGEIILDEQSLVVENKELAKQKEQMQKSNVVDGDFDTGYGVYKKVKRTTPWTEKETLKFYKALNCIGTDFTAMTQLFPKRTRRDLKMKFKKEEKLNHMLVNKAVRQHCLYNFAELKRDADVEAEEEAFLAKLREEEVLKKKEERAEKLKKHQEKISRKNEEVDVKPDVHIFTEDQSRRIDETIEQVLRSVKHKSDEEEQEKEEKNNSSLPLKKRVIGAKRRKSVKIISSSDEDADVSDFNLSEEEEFIPFLKPTRSGRMPKSTIKLDEAQLWTRKRPSKENDAVKIKKPRGAPRKVPSEPSAGPRVRRFSSTSSMDSNAEKLVPGSVVVTTEENAEGKSEYKVFMVTPERKLTSLELESDVIAMLVAEKQQGVTLPLKPAADENNVTIPAECADLTKCDNVEIIMELDSETVRAAQNNVTITEEAQRDNIDIVTKAYAVAENNVKITELAKREDYVTLYAEENNGTTSEATKCDNVEIVMKLDSDTVRAAQNNVTITEEAKRDNVDIATKAYAAAENNVNIGELAKKEDYVTLYAEENNGTTSEATKCDNVEIILEDVAAENNVTISDPEYNDTVCAAGNKVTITEVAKSGNDDVI